jgi:hypothetical protein
MRLHPIIWMLGRVASRDDVIPLAFPITTKSGERVSSIPIKKGTIIDIAIHAYHRCVWLLSVLFGNLLTEARSGMKSAAGVGRGRRRMEARTLFEHRKRQADLDWTLWESVSFFFWQRQGDAWTHKRFISRLSFCKDKDMWIPTVFSC